MCPPLDLPEIFTIPARRLNSAVELLAARGVSTDTVLRQSGIAPDLLSQDFARITSEQLESFLTGLWLATGDEAFGLGSQPVPLGSFRLLAYGTLGKTTLGGVLDRTIRFQAALPGLPQIFVAEDPRAGRARVGFDIDYDPAPVAVLVDTLLVLAHGYLSWLVGLPIELEGVEVPYPPEPDLAGHERLLGAPVTYDARHPCLRVRSELLRAPVLRDDREVGRFFRSAPLHMLTRQGGRPTLSNQVRSMFARQRPGASPPTVDRVAAELALSPQTLRRRLHDEGTSPRAIREDVLRDLAVAGLVRGESVQAVAHRLGFAEPSTFSRAFRRWTGSPPGEYQRDHS